MIDLLWNFALWCLLVPSLLFVLCRTGGALWRESDRYRKTETGYQERGDDGTWRPAK